MTQKRIKEKPGTFDQEISGIRGELHKLPAIKANEHPRGETTSANEMRRRNSEGKFKNLWRNGRIIKQRTDNESIIEGGGTTLKEIKIEGKTNKSEGDENSIVANSRRLKCQYSAAVIRIHGCSEPIVTSKSIN